MLHYRQPKKVSRANRFVRTTPRQKQRQWRWFWRLTLVICLLTSLIWWLFLSDYFTLKQVIMPPTKNFPQGELSQLIWQTAGQRKWGVLPANNLLLLDADRLTEKINQRFYLNDLKIRKKLGHTLLISFQEKDFAVGWQETASDGASKLYYINFQGDIILQPAQPLPDVLIIYNHGHPKAGERQVAVEEKYLTFVDRLNRAFDERIKGLTDRQIFLDNDLNAVKIQINNGPVLIFNTESDLNKQLVKLETIRRQELRDGALFNSQRYLDLRYGDRIFYQ